MKRGVFWISLTCLMLTSLVLASCATSTSTPTSTSTSTSTTTHTTTSTTSVITSTPTTTGSKTTTANGNWWDSLGTPQYGGEFNLLVSKDILFFDPYQGETLMSMMWGWMEQIFAPDWTIDPSVQDYHVSFWSSEQTKGQLVESWEFPKPGTYILRVRHGVYWQNIPPANGREFTADDIVLHYDRLFGLGGGYTKPAPYWGTVAWTKSMVSITATDKYTVVINWNTNNPEFVLENLQMPGASDVIENPEAVKQWGDVIDWHHAIGTGPFILTDYVQGGSMTMVKNPNYWGYDERYPKNKLPYVDKVNYLIIPDVPTALAAMRTGKIDIMDGVTVSDTQQMQKTHPEILKIPIPLGNGVTIDPRNDIAPFNDIRVRKALQMSLDLPTIASSYYLGTADPSPLSLTSMYLKGWGFPYSQWPQDLKDQYAYNPTAAKQLLTDAGFPKGFNTDIVVDINVDLDLLQIVKSYFGAIGVNMEIRTMDAASFASFVGTNHKNDALAQRTAGTLGLCTNPIRELNRIMTGQPSNVAMVSDLVFDAFYTKALAATTIDEVKQILIDANKYVAQQHFVISLLQSNRFNIYQPWVKGFSGQYGATADGYGSFFLFFYEARFWVDQNLKTSMGH